MIATVIIVILIIWVAIAATILVARESGIKFTPDQARWASSLGQLSGAVSGVV